MINREPSLVFACLISPMVMKGSRDLHRVLPKRFTAFTFSPNKSSTNYIWSHLGDWPLRPNHI